MAYNPNLGVVAAEAGGAVRLLRRRPRPSRAQPCPPRRRRPPPTPSTHANDHVRDRQDRRQAVPRRARPEAAGRASEGRRGCRRELEPLLFRSDDAVFDKDGLAGVQVTAKVLGHVRGEKLRVFKFKPKRGYKRRTGHRQELTQIEVVDISHGAKAARKAPAKAKAEEQARSTRRQAAPTARRRKRRPKPSQRRKRRRKPAAAKPGKLKAATKAKAEPAKAKAEPKEKAPANRKPKPTPKAKPRAKPKPP